MRLVIISDTHGRHEDLNSLSGDVLIHCGDFCDGFRLDENDLIRMDQWFAEQDFEHILCIGGNHDFVAQERRRRGESIFKNAIYLQDESIEIGGIRFYGSPWLPDLAGWAYFLGDDERREKWEQIPHDTDVLITHTPPLGILDKPRTGYSVGCAFLRTRVEELRPRIHCFGHVHAAYGSMNESQISFYNACMVDSRYEVTRKPFCVDL